MRHALVATLLLLAAAPVAQAAPDGVPARPMSIGIWNRHDPSAPWPGMEPWTASDLAGFLALHPNAYAELGYEDGKPPGVQTWTAWRDKLGQLRAAGAARGVDLTGRICVSERPDVITHYPYNAGSCNPTAGGGGCDWEGEMDGSLGEAETFVKAAGRATDASPNALVDTRQSWTPDLFANRLVVLRPRSAGEEQRRVTSNGPQHLVVDAPWAAPPQPGDAYEVRGSFDPAWVKRVPLAAHQAALARFWTGARNVCGPLPCRAPAQPLDPFDPANRRGWAPWVDRAAIEALRTATEVPALYGNVADSDEDPRSLVDPHFETVAVVLDVANPAYRAWRARYLLYKLADHGFAPGSAACVLVAYKPGLHTFHDEELHGAGDMQCSEPGTNTWTGPAHVCREGEEMGGPFHATPFRAGEYESAVSAYFREVLTTLTTAGYPNVRVITAEAPPYEHRTWSILADDVRRHPRLVGEQGGWINPPLESLAALDGAGSDPGAGDGGSGVSPDPEGDPVAGGTGTDSPSDGGSEPDPSAGGVAGGSSGSGAPRAPASATSAPAARDPDARGGFVSSATGGGGGSVEPPTAP